MKFRFLLILVMAWGGFAGVLQAANEKQSAKGDDQGVNADPTPLPTVISQDGADKESLSKNPGSAKALFIHKPMPSPSWGRVIQYHREQILALSEKNRETLHEFLFQDDAGVIRTAIYHENASGDGYWEVWVWDQP